MAEHGEEGSPSENGSVREADTWEGEMMTAASGAGTPFTLANFVTKSLLGASPDAGVPTKRTVYWPDPSKERVVSMEDHDFDFNPGASSSIGEIDGPATHNGTYQLLKNEPGLCVMKVKVGTDSSHTSDLDVTLTIDSGMATLIGTVKKGSEKPITYTREDSPVEVKGAGTKGNPFRITFPNAREPEKPVKLVWPK